MSHLDSCVLPLGRDPRHWSRWRRWAIALVVFNLIAPVDMSITFYSGVQQQIQDHFETSNLLATLGVGLYNFGAIFGVLVGGPLSELYGRRPIYIVASLSFVLFTLGAAVAPSVPWLLVCRGLTGLLGSPVFAVYGGTVADLFTPEERGPLMALFTLVLQGAPTLGPVPASLLGPYIPWRWLFILLAIWGVVLAPLVLCLPETESCTIQRRLGKTREDVQVQVPRFYKRGLLADALLTPFRMLWHEPILSWTTLYHAFIYGLLFLLLEGYPHIYQSHYAMTRAQAGMMFLAPFAGNVLGVALYFGWFAPRYNAQQRAVQLASGGKLSVAPEARLPGMLVAAVLTPLGLFWLTATADPQTPFLVPALSGLPVGMGMTLLQLSLFNYYVDLYPTRAASAIAANCGVRNVVAAVFPSVGLPLYHALGIRGANAVLAVVSCVGVPTGVVLYVWGRRLRAASRWAKQDAGAGAGTDEPDVAPLLGQGRANHYGGTSL